MWNYGSGLQKILVPVDFSAPSEAAVGHAITIATRFSAGLTVVSVVEDPVILPYFPGAASGSQDISIDDVKAKLEVLIPAAFRDAHTCRFLVKRGTAEEGLLAAVADDKSDLIVMGSHGRRAFRRWFIGSVAEQMLRRAPVPLLTVSQPEEQRETWAISGGHILYATELPVAETGQGLQIAYDLAQAFNAVLTILHVIDLIRVDYGTLYPPPIDHEQLKDRVLARLRHSVPDLIREDKRVRTEVREGKPHQVILDTATELNADLIVVNLRSKGRIERALLGATADRVVRVANGPVMSVPLIHAP